MARKEEQENAALPVVGQAWVVTCVFFSFQYVLREAPDVMVPQLTSELHASPLGLSSLFVLYFYGYAAFSLIVGLIMDRFGPRNVVPVGAAIVAAGALLFESGEQTMTSVGRFLQGAGGAFAAVGVYCLATTNASHDRRATLIGATHVFGVAGAFAGQFVVGPAIAGGLAWKHFWALMGFFGIALIPLLFISIPAQARVRPPRETGKEFLTKAGAVFANPQSILCGLIAGLLFLPTTLFDMVWAIRFLEEARNVPYEEAVLRSAAVLIGWMVGCPVLGALSDMVGRRKPFIIGGGAFLFGCLALVLYHKYGVLPVYSVGLVAGVASGAAVLTYSVIKEANPPERGNTAIGFVLFMNYGLAALLGPVFGVLMTKVSNGGPRGLIHYQIAFAPLMYCVGLAVVLALFLRETGPAPRPLKMNHFAGTPLKSDQPAEGSEERRS